MMDQTTKDCVKYLKSLIKAAKKGDIIITMMNTDLYHDTECQDKEDDKRILKIPDVGVQI